MPELVSILIPVYNCERWVGAAIESALAQSWGNIEIIALDDASTDGSWNELQKWKSRIHIERAERNGGQNVSRNHLTRLSRGDWLAYLDSDDELAPTAVAEKMKLSGVADAVYGTMEARYYEGARLTGSASIRAEVFPDPLAAAFLWKYPNTSSLLFRRSAVLEAGGWNEAIQNCTDYDLYFRLLVAGKKFSAAPGSVSVYRHWTGAQAVHEAPLRRTMTRLELMWRAVLDLERHGRLTSAVREAFSNAALGVIRTLFQFDRPLALREHARLKAWDRQFAPSGRHFPGGYRAGYRILGFRGAELLAAATRFMRPRPSGDMFPRSRAS